MWNDFLKSGEIFWKLEKFSEMWNDFLKSGEIFWKVEKFYEMWMDFFYNVDGFLLQVRREFSEKWTDLFWRKNETSRKRRAFWNGHVPNDLVPCSWFPYF